MDTTPNCIARQISNGIINGAVVLAGTVEKDLFSGAYGFADRENNVLMSPASVFDIASVTKVIGTTNALLTAIEAGKIELDRPFTDYIPKFRTVMRETVTVRMLATHISGISMAYPQISPAEVMRDAFLDITFPENPGIIFQYTCTAFILLGLIIENVMGETLDKIVSKKVFQKLGMSDTRWTQPPVGAQERTIRTINAAPGIISDPGARAFFPQALGNAGIFSTASDLAKYCRMMLKNDGSIFAPEVLNLCFKNCNPPEIKHARSIGWDMEEHGIPGGLSQQTIYHSGWTGQTVWIDPVGKCFVIVLTNRCGDWTKARDGRINIAEEILTEIH